MSRCGPFRSAKINIWPSVLPLRLIRGHPGLHTQLVDWPRKLYPEQQQAWATRLCSPSSQLFLTQMLEWHWNYLLIKDAVSAAHPSAHLKEKYSCFYCKEVILFFFMLLNAYITTEFWDVAFQGTHSAKYLNFVIAEYITAQAWWKKFDVYFEFNEPILDEYVWIICKRSICKVPFREILGIKIQRCSFLIFSHRRQLCTQNNHELIMPSSWHN